MRVGPYEIGKRYPGISEDDGQLYEARHVETGEAALAVMPGTGDDWRTRVPWAVVTTHYTQPDLLIVHPRRRAGEAAPSHHELALGYIRTAAALSLLSEREDARTLFTREAQPSRPRSPVLRWGLACASVALSLGLVLLLWPRATERREWDDVFGDSPVFANEQDTIPELIAYPMPEKPFKEQRTPPCLEGRDVEIRGGCWIPHRANAPCPKGTAEYQGQCYMPVKKPAPLPSSAKP